MTALSEMAAPARPGVSEARVPCPRCGGLVHPVAGRCKHCKEDLTTFRAGRPQAAIPLPSLLSNGKGNGKNGHTPVPAIVMPEESAPILPPRESAHGMPAQGTHSTWRRWPIVVIVLAGLAIVGAMVVMFWLPPSSGGNADSHGLKPPPAPERMELNPIPPPNSDPQSADPWGAPQPQAPRAPHAQRAPITPDPIDPDPFASNGGPVDPFGGGAPLGGGGNLDFVATFGRHLCDRLTQCGNSSDEVTSYCNLMKAMPAPGAAPTCASAKKCLDHVDTMSCTLQGNDAAALSALVTQIPDCLDAITRC